MPKKDPRLDGFADLKREIVRSPMSVETIAARAGVAPSTIYFWLRGATRNPSVDAMDKVARALGKKITFVDGAFALEPLMTVRETQRARARTALWRFRR